jgi:hypothetical protein
MAKTKTEDVLSRTYYSIGRPSEYSTSDKLRAAEISEQGHSTRAVVNAFLETQDAHTLHRPVRKRFPCNAYVVGVLDL